MRAQGRARPPRKKPPLRFPRDFIHDTYFSGPRAVLTALAHEQAGHAELARADWRAAVQAADRELGVIPDDDSALHWKVWARARLGVGVARDEVAAATGGKQGDDLRVARADRDDGHDGGERDEDGEVGIRAERAERFLGAVARGGEAVRPEADPREERDERDLVEEVAIGERAGLAEENGFEGGQGRKIRSRMRAAAWPRTRSERKFKRLSCRQFFRGRGGRASSRAGRFRLARR